MLLYITLFVSIFSDISIAQARQTYELAVGNVRIADTFLKQTNNTQNYVMLGYRGAVTMAKAKHYNNPIKKLETFTTGKNILENVINTNKNNIELRYLRFSVQINCPAFLGYNNISNDKKFLLTNLPICNDSYLKDKIIAFMLQCSTLTAKEKEVLRYIAKTNVIIKP